MDKTNSQQLKSLLEDKVEVYGDPAILVKSYQFKIEEHLLPFLISLDYKSNPLVNSLGKGAMDCLCHIRTQLRILTMKNKGSFYIVEINKNEDGTKQVAHRSRSQFNGFNGDVLNCTVRIYADSKSKVDELREVSKDYLKARKDFLKIANKTTELSGNDNIIGRIGEFIAYQFLQYRNPQKNENKTQKGYDIVCDKNTRVSVKTITYENETGRTMRIKDPYDELILIEINEQGKIERLGHLTKSQFELARQENPNYSKEPYCKRTMLNEKGLIGRYGKVYTEKELKIVWL